MLVKALVYVLLLAIHNAIVLIMEKFILKEVNFQGPPRAIESSQCYDLVNLS